MDLHIFSIILLIIPLVVNGAATCNLSLFESHLSELIPKVTNCISYNDSFQCYTAVNNKYHHFVIPKRQKCTGTDLINTEYIEICSSPPQRLYVKRGKNTSLVSFTKRGNPTTTYYECARYVYKKASQSREDDIITMCSGASERGEKTIESSDFGASSLKVLNSYSELVNNLACNSKWDSNKGKKQLQDLYNSLNK